MEESSYGVTIIETIPKSQFIVRLIEKPTICQTLQLIHSHRQTSLGNVKSMATLPMNLGYTFGAESDAIKNRLSKFRKSDFSFTSVCHLASLL